MDVLNFLKDNWLALIIVGIVAVLIYRWIRNRGTGSTGTSAAPSVMPAGFVGNAATAVAVVVVTIIVAVTVLMIFNPKAISGLWTSGGPFAAGQFIEKAKAELYATALDPSNPEASFTGESKPVAAFREAIATDYQLATAKNKAGISAAEADRLSHLPKGHPDRALWDAAKMDPAAGSLPPAVQVAQSRIGEIAENAGKELKSIDLAALNKELAKPFGQAPADVDPWFKQWFYGIPTFVWAMIALIVSAVLMIKTLKVLLRT